MRSEQAIVGRGGRRERRPEGDYCAPSTAAAPLDRGHLDSTDALYRADSTRRLCVPLLLKARRS